MVLPIPASGSSGYYYSMEDAAAANPQAEGERILDQPVNPDLIRQEEKKKLVKYIIIGVLVCVLVGALFFIWKYYLNSPNYLKLFLNFCFGLKELTLLNVLLMTCVVIFCQFSFVPGQSTFVAVVSYFIGNYFVALGRFLMILWPVKIGGFFLVRGCLYDWAYQKFKDYDIYKAIKGESEKNPWTTAMMMNSLWLVSSIKMYVIPLLSIKYYQFIPTFMIGETLYLSMNVMVGVQIRDIQLFIEKGPESISEEQKWSALGFGVFALLTGIFLLTIFIKVGRRVAELKAQNNQEEERLLREHSYERNSNMARNPNIELV